MSDEELTEVIDVAYLIYGIGKKTHDAKADKLILGKMVKLEIITDSGHLTTTFRDYLQKLGETFIKLWKKLLMMNLLYFIP